MMSDGERQVAPTLDGIRRDHVARYEWVAKRLPVGLDAASSAGGLKTRVIDFACGVGYGTRVLADAGHLAYGYDIDAEAIAYALEHYWTEEGPSPQPVFGQRNGNVPGELGEYDVAVCFETIEHIEDPRPLLKALRVSAPLLIASVPNEAVMPWQRADGSTTAFHFRHYTKHEFNALLQECGWRVTEWHGQAGPESEVERDINGRTLIAVASRDELPEEDPVRGKHIVIVGLGASLDQYVDQAKRVGGRHRFCDQVWAINALGEVLDCDLVFHMDDVRIQEIRAKARPASNIAAMLEWIKISRVPVVTSRKHPDYPALVEYPLEDVLNHLGHEYFNCTPAYAIAMAIHAGAAKISCFGLDFTYPNRHDAEKGRACCEFWLGQAHARGIELGLPSTSTLMDSVCGRAGRLYGYDTLDVGFDIQEDGHLKLNFVARETLPTADEIEKNYDHSAPIAKQHLSTKTQEPATEIG